MSTLKNVRFSPQIADEDVMAGRINIWQHPTHPMRNNWYLRTNMKMNMTQMASLGHSMIVCIVWESMLIMRTQFQIQWDQTNAELVPKNISY